MGVVGQPRDWWVWGPPCGRDIIKMKIPALATNQSLLTLPETNIFARKNGWLEYYCPIGDAYFQWLC